MNNSTYGLTPKCIFTKDHGIVRLNMSLVAHNFFESCILNNNTPDEAAERCLKRGFAETVETLAAKHQLTTI